jgi:hypothetical protein
VTATTRRQIVLLALLAAVLAVVLFVQFSGDDGPRSSAVPSGGTARRPAGVEADVPVTGLNLAALQSARPDLPDAERNPFRFERRLSAREAADERATARAALMTQEEMMPLPPPPRPIPLRFIGLIGGPASGGRLAVFSDRRGNVFQAREGDIIEGQYRVLRVGEEAAELVHLDGGGRQSIRLSGQ